LDEARNLYKAVVQFVAPPPPLTVSEFAREHRILSQENAAQSGRWENVGYQEAMQDAATPGKTVVLMTSTQVGKTEILKNILMRSMAYLFSLDSVGGSAPKIL
jgi:phage terminase large subunit GpA-like protein